MAGVAACAAPGPRPVAPTGPTTLEAQAVARDWHTDIGLATVDLRGPLLRIADDFPDARHLLFGFGERAYWTRPDRALGDMLLALLPGPGAVLVTGLRASPVEAFGDEDVVRLAISQEGMDRLCAFLWATLELDAGGQPHFLKRGPYPGSLFYASARRYAAHYTCNTWTAHGLQAAGVPVDASGVLLAGQLMRRLRQAALRSADSAGGRSPAA